MRRYWAGLGSEARATRSQTSSTRARSESPDAVRAAARSSCARLSARSPRYNSVRTSTTGGDSAGGAPGPAGPAVSSSSDAGPMPPCSSRWYAAHEPTRSGVSGTSSPTAPLVGWATGRAVGGAGAGGGGGTGRGTRAGGGTAGWGARSGAGSAASAAIGTIGVAPGPPSARIRSIRGSSSAESASSSPELERVSTSPTRRSSAANAAAWLTASPRGHVPGRARAGRRRRPKPLGDVRGRLEPGALQLGDGPLDPLEQVGQGREVSQRGEAAQRL